MKAVILAGGLGTRLGQETSVRPKPMVEIGGKPILWHIMNSYSAHGVNEFIICLGYKGYMIKEYFANYFLHLSDVTIDLKSHALEVHDRRCEPWRVTLIDTGEKTMTGGRLKRIRRHLDDDAFCFTYGDGLSDVDISELIAFHKSQGTLATITVVQPPGRFGSIQLNGDISTGFTEKAPQEGNWINGGFFVLSQSVIDRIEGDETMWEREPLEGLAADGQLSAYRHRGFWQCMDTPRERNYLEDLWEAGRAPWAVRSTEQRPFGEC